MTTTRTRKRLAGIAVLAFGGSVLLGACDPQETACDALFAGAEQLEDEIGDLEGILEGLDENDPVRPALELKLTGMEELLELKWDAIDAAQCEGQVTESL